MGKHDQEILRRAVPRRAARVSAARPSTVVDVFYRNKSGTRYLVADETGLGKSLIAWGVIASAIEHMQDDKDIKRIDVIYVCSNADVARQNVKRLDAPETVDMPTRPSLLVAKPPARDAGD